MKQQIRKLEADIADADLDADRIRAVLPVFEARIAEARRREENDALAAKVVVAACAIERWNAWCDENYKRLATELAEGLRLEQAAFHASRACVGGPGIVAPPLPEMRKAFDGHRGGIAFGSLISLPANQPHTVPIWRRDMPVDINNVYAH